MERFRSRQFAVEGTCGVQGELYPAVVSQERKAEFGGGQS